MTLTSAQHKTPLWSLRVCLNHYAFCCIMSNASPQYRNATPPRCTSVDALAVLLCLPVETSQPASKSQCSSRSSSCTGMQTTDWRTEKLCAQERIERTCWQDMRKFRRKYKCTQLASEHCATPSSTGLHRWWTQHSFQSNDRTMETTQTTSRHFVIASRSSRGKCNSVMNSYEIVNVLTVHVLPKENSSTIISPVFRMPVR